MRTLIITTAIAALGLVGFSASAYADESSVETSCYVGLSHDYVAGNLGVVLSEGLHLQGGCDATHKSGFYAEVWATTDGYLVDGKFEASDDDGFTYEADVMFGWKGEVAKDLMVRTDYALFQVGTGSSTEVVENARLFVNWNRDGIQPYARFQYFLTDGYGPGKGLAHVVGVNYGQFAAEVGGHDGLFGQDATFASFGRVGFNSKPVKELGGATIGIQLQKGFEDPVDDQFIVGINRSF